MSDYVQFSIKIVGLQSGVYKTTKKCSHLTIPSTGICARPKGCILLLIILIIIEIIEIIIEIYNINACIIEICREY